MASKYRPQIPGWIADLNKNPTYLMGEDDRLLYANDNYCAFIRKIEEDQIFYSFLFLLALVMAVPGIFIGFELCFSLINFHDKEDIYFFMVDIILLFTMIFAFFNIILPGLYQNLFTRRGSPIIFNRKTGQVYVNESYFFNFRILYNPIYLFHPNKKRIKEYDWAHLQGVVVHNFSRNSLVTIILMVCKPHTHKTIDHILLDPLRAGVGSYLVWGWVNNFMCFDDLIDLNEGKYKTDEELQFKQEIIEGQGWPEWMVEAFNATTHDELADIKQKYTI